LDSIDVRFVDKTCFFDNPKKAHEVLNRLKVNICDYGYVTVKDFFDCIGKVSTTEDGWYGWIDLSEARLSYVKGQWLILLPSPVRLFASEEVIGDEITSEPSDMVNHPPHYKSETGLEVIDVIEAFTFDLKGIEATDTGNIIKYICRWKNKNGIEDLKKARWYLNHLITHIEKLEQEDI
jgi:hypothetical protein